MVVYGLKTCDTCRKALAALKAAGREVVFRDVRAEPLSAAERDEFLETFGAALVNRASATWRGLAEAERATAPEELLARHPTLMKRPLIRDGAALYLGWTAHAQAALLK